MIRKLKSGEYRLYVDAAGTVHLVWPTVVSGPMPDGALFYASTRDGRTCTLRARIPTLGGPKPSHPQIVIDSSRRIVVAWDEVVDGERVAAAREVKPQPHQPIEFGPVVTLSSTGHAMYPVLAATDRAVLAVWTTGGETAVIQARHVRLP